jgi:hypothetical protein
MTAAALEEELESTRALLRETLEQLQRNAEVLQDGEVGNGTDN